MTKIEGMHCFTHTPLASNVEEEELEKVFTEMFDELQASTPDEFVHVFNTSLNNSDLPTTGSRAVGSRSSLRSVVNTAYDLADKLGEEGTAKLEATILEFNEWCSGQIAVIKEGSNNKQKYVCLSQQSYDGGNKQVFNTRHM